MPSHRTIDCHVHLVTVEAIEGFLQIMDQAAIDTVGVACIPFMGPHTNALGLLMKAFHSQKTFTFGGLDYAPPDSTEHGLDFAAQAQRLVSLGADGMKMIEGKPNARRETGLALDAPEYDPYYTWLQQQGVPILWHVADPEEFWDEDAAPQMAKDNNWLYTDPSFPSKEQLYEESERVLDAYPDLKVVFAHFRFLSADLERAAAFLDAHPSVCFDLTPGSEMYFGFSRRPTQWREFFVTYQDRILFGTDNTAHTESLREWGVENVARIRGFLETSEAFSGPGLALDGDVLDKIYAGNFERIFGTAANPVDIPGLIAHSAIQLEHARASESSPEHIGQLEQIMQKLSALV